MFTCEVCEEVFPTFGAMDSHHRGAHAPTRSFPCPICQRQFKTPAMLHRHSPLHTRRRYMCDACGKIYSARCKLSAHIRSSHTFDTELTTTHQVGSTVFYVTADTMPIQ
eukprot:Lithocolla_globosa_v1_NODE_684_length_3444_cov_23.143755.p5 type:complete len:109 gc:universal NODE_684_length_3444_cov_23.143755:353-27(-)